MSDDVGLRIINRLVAVGLGLALLAAGTGAVGAEATPGAPPPAASARSAVFPIDLAEVRVDSAAGAQALADAIMAEAGPPVRSLEDAAELRFNHRRIATFRASLADLTPADRAAGAVRRLERALAGSDDRAVAVYPVSYGAIFTVGTTPIFSITNEDLDEAGGESLREASAVARATLERVVRESTEERRLPYLLRAVGYALLAALLAGTALLLLLRLRRALTARLARTAELQFEKARLGHLALSGSAHLYLWMNRALSALVWVGGLPRRSGRGGESTTC